MISGRLLSYSKKKKISRNGHSLSFVVIRCHSLSLVVIRCTTRCHSLYHSLSLVVIHCTTRCTTHCYSLSLVVPLVVTRCTTRLSFYKRSLKFLKHMLQAICSFSVLLKLIKSHERIILLRFIYELD